MALSPPPLSKFLATPLDLSMPLPTNINERNAAINHGRIVLQNHRMNILEVLKLIELLLLIGIKTTRPGFGWNIPTCWRLCFVFIAVSSMPQ